MRGVLMGAVGGLGKGMAEVGQLRMKEDSELRMKKQLLEMEEQIRKDREAAIAARRERIMASATTPEEIERAAVMAGDDGLARHGSGLIERATSESRYKDDQGWKQKDYDLRDRAAKEQADAIRRSDARGWADINLRRDEYNRKSRQDAADRARADDQRELLGAYLMAKTSGDDALALDIRLTGMSDHGVDFENEARKAGGKDSYSAEISVVSTYQKLYENLVKEAGDAVGEERKRLLAQAAEARRKAQQAADAVADRVGMGRLPQATRPADAPPVDLNRFIVK